MDFQNINPFNARLNLLSGNLLPMAEKSSFSVFWKIYSSFVWLLHVIFTVTLIPGCFLVPKVKAFNDAVICLVVMAEAIFVIVRIHAYTTLVQQLIQKLNKTLSIEDENMKNIVVKVLKTMEIPFKLYLGFGTIIAFFWSIISVPVVFEKSEFYYVDLKNPAFYAKEPFSLGIYLLSTAISLATNMYIFVKKVSVDIYTTHLISLVTAQYQYITFRLILTFRNNEQQDNNSFRKNHSSVNTSLEIKKICRQHIDVISITSMLKKLLAVNVSFIYVNNIFRFCFIGVMLIISANFVEALMVIIYGSGSLMQFYISCACFQRLSEASTDMTDEAFHEDWNRLSIPVKRTFLLLTMASNNMDLRIALFENLNLSLPSFMSVLNKSYSFALLILRMK